MVLKTIEMGEGPPLLLLHGLFGSARNWGAIQKQLARRRRVLAMDLRNHGDSPHGSGMGYVAQARDVAETLAARHAQGAAVVGHSMGGKTAMALALGHPGLISRLVVADIAPRRYPPALRGYVAAMRGLELRPGLSRREADAALADAVPEAGIRAFLVQSIDFGGDAPRWTLGLAEIAAGMGEIEDFAVAGQFAAPTLVLSGARSDYVAPADHALFQRLFPAARFATVERAGHWLHADNPQGFLSELEHFLP
jgi:pimeloyl-ACP methyl ester carboxylesterase